MEISGLVCTCAIAILALCILLPLIRFKNCILRWILKTVIAAAIVVSCYSYISASYYVEPFIPADNPIVYVTTYGTNYHTRGCGYLWNGAQAISLYDAVISHYGRCSRCNPPQFSSSDYSAIIESITDNTPGLDSILMSFEYLLPSVCFSFVIWLLIYFDTSEKAKSSGHIYISGFVNHFCIAFGVFCLPALIIVFTAVFTFSSVIALIYGLIQSLFSFIKNHFSGPTIRRIIIDDSPPPMPVSQERLPVGAYKQKPEPIKSSGYQICRFIWTCVDSFITQNIISFTLAGLTYLWTSLFYVVVKSVRRQTLIDDIYSFFPAATEDYFKNRYLKPLTVVIPAYRKLRLVLNASNIDPRTDEGICALYSLVIEQDLSNNHFPLSAKDGYVRLAKLVQNYSMSQLQRNSIAGKTVKYSISELENNCDLPVN